MKTLEELKETWGGNQNTHSDKETYNQMDLEEIFNSRVKKHTNVAMRYFWASFTLQIIVYALLSHVIVKYWSDIEVLGLSMLGILLFLPFTIMLMHKFKSIARIQLSDTTETSLHQYVLRHYELLLSFYRFKKRYELLLIPLSSAIGIIVSFKLFVPGGIYEHTTGAVITFIITLLSCAFAIHSENKKSFKQPLQQLHDILEEFKSEV